MTNSKKISDYNVIMINLDGLRRDKAINSDVLNSLIKDSYFFSEMNTVDP